MPVGKYLQKKRLQKYCQGYIQYEKLIYHLKEVMDLDKRKFSHFAYDIIPNPKGNGYLVTPKVSEEEIEECYSKFVLELRHELDRVDAYFINFVNQVELKLNVIRSELFEKTFNTQFWPTKESNQFHFQNLLKELEVIKVIIEDFKTNIIPINKFTLIKIYEKQQYLVGKTSSKLETYDNGKEYLNWELDHWMDQPLINRYSFCSNGNNIISNLLKRIDCLISKCRIKFLPKVLNEELIF